MVQQTLQDWEMIIVDDGSTDDSLNIAQRHAANDTRIKAIPRSRTPKGACTCRNEGLELARGEFVIFLDSDDLLKPSCLQERIQRFNEAPENDFIACYPEIFNEEPGDSNEIWGRVYTDYLGGFLDKAAWITIAVTWRTDWVRKLGGWKEGLPSFQDWELHIRALIKQPRYGVFAEARDAYLRRGTDLRISGQSQRDKEHLQSRRQLAVDIFDQLVANDLLNPKRKQSLVKQFLRTGLLSSLANDPENARDCTRQISNLGLIESPLTLQAVQLYAAFEQSKFFRLPIIAQTLRRAVKLLFMPFVAKYIL